MADDKEDRDGTDHTILNALADALQKEGAIIELVAPKVGGVMLSNNKSLPAHQTIEGAPSVLYDAVAIIPSEDGTKILSKLPEALDFLNDACAHCKFIGFTTGAAALMDAPGLSKKSDHGFLAITDDKSIEQFVESCRQLRFWDREQMFA